MATGRVPDLACTWAPLHAALQQHVRIPLLRDHSEDWKDTSPTQIGEKFTRKGQISVNDSRETALWYTLAYSCMHFDALRDLMNTDEFKQATGLQNDRIASVLHVDFGCGPGTSSWAVMKSIPDTVRLDTIGLDHNPHMVSLAKAMVHTLAQSASKTVAFDFLSDWRRFQRRVLRSTKGKDILLVTVNSLFGQQSFTSPDFQDLLELIVKLRVKTQGIPNIIFGMHPPWSIKKVNGYWEKLAITLGSTTIYDQELGTVSLSPTKYTDDIGAAWHPWTPQPQLARILVLPPSGGNR